MKKIRGSTRSICGTRAPSRRRFLSRLVAVPLAAGAAETLGAAARVPSQPFLPYRPTQPPDWDEVRDQFLIATGMSYFDCGSLGPTPAPVFYSLVDGYRALANYPMDRERLRQRKKKLKERVAAFIGASGDEIVITRNTTEGLSLVAAGLDLKPGNEVLLTNYEHGSGIGPWRIRRARHGVAVRELEIPLDPQSADEILQIFDRAAGPQTRVMAISHVTTYTGLVLPVRELCAWARQRGILSVIDGAQAVGMIPVNVKEIGCDFYATSPHKWLHAPQGTGVLYVRRDVQDRCWPTVADAGWERAEAIGKYERLGQVSDPLALAVSAAVDFQAAIGQQAIRDRIHTLAARFKQGLDRIAGARLWTSRSEAFSGGITTFAVRDYPNVKLMDWLARKHNIIVDVVGKDFNGARVSTHIYNSFEQVDRLLEALAHASAKGVS